MKKTIKKIFRNIMAIVKKPEMRILPGQLAFFFVLSIIPIFAIIIIIGSSLSLSSDAITSFFEGAFPSGIVNTLMEMLDYSHLDTNVIIFLISTFIIASNGTFSIINASNTIYKTEPTSWLRRRVKAVFLTFSMVFLLLFILLIPTFGSNILSFIGNIPVLNEVIDKIIFVFNLCSVPISIFVVYFTLKLMYVISPDKKIKSRTVTSGALFTTFGWIISSRIYSYYVTHFSKYDLVYGGLANIIILMLWFYILAYIFVIGMSLNVLSEKENNVSYD